MKKSQFSERQIIGFIKEAEAGMPMGIICCHKTKQQGVEPYSFAPVCVDCDSIARRASWIHLSQFAPVCVDCDSIACVT